MATPFILGMRDYFFDALFPLFQQHKDAIFITADNGAPTLDRYAEELPGQFHTVGIAEQQVIGMAAGMAFEGRKVYTYAIAPFITLRCIEQIKIDICAMNLPVVCLGIGAGYAYDIMGPTHHTVEDLTVMRVLPNLKIFSPADSITAGALAEVSFRDPSPQYIRFDRTGVPNLYEGRTIPVDEGLIQVREGRDVTLVATGIMVHQAIKVAELLQARGVDAGVIDIFRIKPLNSERLLNLIGKVPRVVSMEEHLLAGGLGSLLAETFADEGVLKPLLRIGQNDRFVFENGGRENLWEIYGLDEQSITARVLRWMGA